MKKIKQHEKRRGITPRLTLKKDSLPEKIPCRDSVKRAFCLCVNTYFDTICVHPLKSAYTLSKFAYSYAKMRTVKLTDKLEFVYRMLFMFDSICFMIFINSASLFPVGSGKPQSSLKALPINGHPTSHPIEIATSGRGI